MGSARFAREDSGQTVVLVALMFTVLMGFAALGIDVGRFYSERRYLQDAVDAAALACAYQYAQTGQPSAGWTAADDLLQSRNLLGNPLGIDVTYPRPFTAALVYDGASTPHNLTGGILPVNTNGLGCRVAITVQVPTFLIKIVSPALNTIAMTTRGYAKSKGGFLPSVVQRWANPPGPGLTSADNQFHDRVMALGSDWNCTNTNTAGCIPASVTTPGREFVLFGQSATATNDSSFRGYIALDIRNFTTTDGSGNLIHMQNEPGFFNKVDVTTSINILKDLEANWILHGYHGPDICPVEVGNFAPCAQLAVLNGSSSGIFVEDYEDRFNVGDKLLLQLYDGTVKTVPDFNIQSGTLTLPINGQATSLVQYTFSPQFAISGATVETTLLPDNGSGPGKSNMTTDSGGTPATNPFLNGCAVMSTPEFSANPTLPNQSTYTQIWNTITTDTNCDRGIFQAWLRGTSSAPYTSRVHETLVNINVGGQARDFSLGSSDAFASIVSPGDPADLVIRTTTSTGGSTKWTGNNLLTLSWAKCPTTTNTSIVPAEPLICGINGTYALVPGALPAPVTGVDPGENHTFNVMTTLARSGEVYKGWVRETGLDDVTNKRVTHLLEVTIEVGIVPGGATQYADVLGFAVFEVTQINSNEVWGRAITGAYLDPNDQALAIGRKIGLVPWEEP
jgi:Flp pilus assembly protein TadG